MKKILSILLVLAMLISSLALFACEDDESSSSTEELSSSSESSSESESESESEVTDPADIVDPDAPEDETLTIFEGGSTDYVLIYDVSDTVLGEHVDDFVEFISEEHGVTLETRGKSTAESEHEIIVGGVRDNAKFVINKLYETNDFAISVCGDDLVLYATSEYLYPYLFEIAKELLDADKSTFEPKSNFIYHKSSYKDVPYAGYLRLKNGTISVDTLADSLFEARTFTAKDGTKIPYRIYIPSSYDPDSELPVVTFLHGAGERGSDNKAQLKNYVPELFSQAKSPYWSSIVICPQCPSGQQWVDTPWSNGSYSTKSVEQSNELTAVLELIDEIKAEYSTDTSRYYVTGISMGGFGTWDLIMRHPDLFAGAMPICGGADPDMASVLVNKPIRTFHGTKDDVVPYSGTQEMVNAIKSEAQKAGAETKIIFTPINGGYHTIWSDIGKNSGYSKWLFEQSLEKNTNE